MVEDPFQKNVSENLAKYTEQCDATVVTTVQTILLPLPEKDDHAAQQVRGNGIGLPDGNQGSM